MLMSHDYFVCVDAVRACLCYGTGSVLHVPCTDFDFSCPFSQFRSGMSRRGIVCIPYMDSINT